MNYTVTPSPASYLVIIPGSLRELTVPAAGLRWFHDVGPLMKPSGLRKIRLTGDSPYLMPAYQPGVRSAFAIRVVVLEDLETAAPAESNGPEPIERIASSLPPRAKALSRKVRIETLLKRDGCECWYCGQKLGMDISIEHLVARSLGGPEVAANEVLAHRRCNSLGGDLSVVEKLTIREALRSLSTPAAAFAPQDGQVTRDRVRWCTACGAEHGASYLCPKYSATVREMAETFEPPPLQPHEHGDGNSSLLSGFVAGGAR